MRMNDSDRWVSNNLQRQKELLERQRQRKLQANLSCAISTTNNQWNFSVDGTQCPPPSEASAGPQTFGGGEGNASQTQNDRPNQSRGSLYSFMSSPSPANNYHATNNNNPFGSSIGNSAANEPKVITVKGITPPQSRKQSASSESDGTAKKMSRGNAPLKKPILTVERLEPVSSSFGSEGEDEDKAFHGLGIHNDDVAQISPSSTTVLAYKRPSWNVDGEDDEGSIPTEILNEEPMETLDLNDNLEQFVMEPIRKNYTLKCRITRDKRGMDKGIYPIYYLHLEKNDGRRTFLLAARKRKKSTTANYLISIDPTDLRRNGRSFIAKVRSNAMGTMFSIFDNGESPKKSSAIGDSVRRELAAVIYETNVLGLKGPRKMTIIIPGIYVDQKNNYIRPLSVRPISEKDSILERYKTNRLEEMVVLINKQPVWNEVFDTQSYVLNFHGRVTQASVKNFQIVHSMHAQSYNNGHQKNALNAADPNEYVIMQFGRIDNESFTMDVRYPLSPVQAFGIAMTSFHGKLACE